MKEIYFVTSNKKKVEEIASILERKINQISMDIPEIQALEVEKVVKDKAKRAYLKIRKPVLVEDTGVYISALNNFPGALIKWLLKTIGNEGICKSVNKNRNIKAKTCFCLYNGRHYHIFIGELEGTLARKPLGETGFGWDPIFIPKGSKKSFAQLSKEEKNKISMRFLALEKLKNFLNHN